MFPNEQSQNCNMSYLILYREREGRTEGYNWEWMADMLELQSRKEELEERGSYIFFAGELIVTKELT